MTISLHEVISGTFEQILTATDGVLAKGLSWCDQQGIDPGTVIDTRLHDDMLPLRFQVVSVWHHSLGALRGAAAGEFAPPPKMDLDYAGLQKLVTEARAGVAAYDPDQLNALADAELLFKVGGTEIPFTGKDFLLGFSLPNFYFHATTSYAILRQLGVPLGKRDFLGAGLNRPA